MNSTEVSERLRSPKLLAKPDNKGKIEQSGDNMTPRCSVNCSAVKKVEGKSS